MERIQLVVQLLQGTVQTLVQKSGELRLPVNELIERAVRACYGEEIRVEEVGVAAAVAGAAELPRKRKGELRRLGVNIPHSMWNWINDRAKRRGRSATRELIEALELYIETYEKCSGSGPVAVFDGAGNVRQGFPSFNSLRRHVQKEAGW